MGLVEKGPFETNLRRRAILFIARSLVRWYLQGVPVRLHLLIPSAIPALSGALSVTGAEPPVDFTRDVRPILSQHCFACHGPDEAAREAALDLTGFDSATAALEGGVFAITPGDPAASELWLRINDDEDPMPPREAHKPLDPEQIERLRRWIESGASYAPHWAWVTPERTGAEHEPPAAAWSSSPYDQLLHARLAEEGFAPAADADPVTLMRRLTLDLTGLPPSGRDVAAYLAADPAHRYEALVDRLLASPHYGEHLAAYWLDLVRYADTVGYHGDQEHRVWPYRDWVIKAFNENMPFDAFTRRQLAGDLLPEPDQDDLVASAYNRLLQTTHEGGLQLKEYRAIYMADRVRNASQVWMGATLGCAQCHDHKYDPFTAHDFHAFGAFFADIDDEEHLRKPYDGLNANPTRRDPELRLETEVSRARRGELDALLAAERAALAQSIDALPSEAAAWEGTLSERVATARPRVLSWVDDELTTGGSVQGDWNFVREAAVEPASGSLYRRQSSPGLVQHYSLDTTRITISVEAGQMLFAWVRLDPEDPPKAVMLQCHAAGSWEHRAVWGSDDIVYGLSDASRPAYQRMGALPAAGAWHRLEVPFASIGLEPGAVVDGIAFTQFGGTVLWDQAGAEADGPAPVDVLDALATERTERTDAQIARLRAFQRAESPVVRAHETRLDTLVGERAAITDRLERTLYTRTLETPREVRILPRGNWLDESGPLVEPAIPAVFGSIPVTTTGARPTRLDLAEWLCLPQEQGGVDWLTARVFVNRIWGRLFGEALCPSVEDLGGQGRPPTNLPLLDLLTLDFIDSGWDIKALVRSLVLTRAYRQSSIPDPELARHDPENLLSGRQSRHRMSAEMVRDTALKVSGLLVDHRGGRSVKPPQPAGYYRHLNFPTRSYHPDTDESQWRRGVYVHWQRQFLHPMLRAFDAPTREECTARRTESNTPLAALVLMNDPTYVEAARAFAERVLLEAPADDAARISFAMREATARIPTPEEVGVLQGLLEASRLRYAEEPDAVEALLSVGSAPRSTAYTPAELAAWTHLTRTMLNLHETITRE